MARRLVAICRSWFMLYRRPIPTGRILIFFLRILRQALLTESCEMPSVRTMAIFWRLASLKRYFSENLSALPVLVPPRRYGTRAIALRTIALLPYCLKLNIGFGREEYSISPTRVPLGDTLKEATTWRIKFRTRIKLSRPMLPELSRMKPRSSGLEHTEKEKKSLVIPWFPQFVYLDVNNIYVRQSCSLEMRWVSAEPQPKSAREDFIFFDVTDR